MIVPFYGEFLHHPAALEMSLGECSYRCRYCFEQTRGSRKPPKVKSAVNLVRDYRHRETLEARLLQLGYPVCVSNRTDPFSSGPDVLTLPLLDALAAEGIPVYVQTKGGREALAYAKRQSPRGLWYVTISTLRPEIASMVEPGAPLPVDRLNLVSELAALGHTVVVGLNPGVPEWADPDGFLETIMASGAHGLFESTLHFSRTATLSETMVKALSPQLVARAQAKKYAPEEYAFQVALEDACLEAGLPAWIENQKRRTSYFELDQKVYPRRLPSDREFEAWCFDHCHGKPLVVTFEDFWNVIGPSLPAGEFRLTSYVGSVAHQVCKDTKIPKFMTYRSLVKLMWTDHRIGTCPIRDDHFRDLVEVGKDGKPRTAKDETGTPVVVFRPDPYEDVPHYTRDDLAHRVVPCPY